MKRINGRALKLNCVVVLLAMTAMTLIAIKQNVHAQGAQGLNGQDSAKEVRLQGELEVIYEDAHPSGRLLYFLHTVGKKFSVHFTGEPPTGLRSGMRVDVRGVQVGETLELNSGGSMTQTAGAPAVSGNPMGQHRVLVIMVNFQDEQTQPFSQADAQTVMFGTTSDFYREASYGQTWLTGDVFGWYTIPVSYTACDTTAIASYAQQAAAAAGANLSAYDHYVYAFPQNACGWQGRGSVGGTPSEAWINEWFELGIVGHELGHNFGLYHSRSSDCGAFSIGSNCTTNEYGDTLDIMGGGTAHFNLYQKERLGWANGAISPPITNVTSTGTYWVDSYEQTGLNPKGLKILKSTDPVTGMRTWYYVEHRYAFGFDNFLSGNTNVLSGVVVHTGSESGGQENYLLDMTPSTTSWYDPALTAGQSFNDPDAGVTITTLSADATGAMVAVTVAPQPCVRANPTLTVSPSQSPWLRSGSTANFTVSLKNNDGVGCTTSNFNWQAVVPSGWFAGFGSPVLSVDPGSTATTNLQVTSAVGAADGFYGINMSAANGSSPANLSSGSATYSLVSALAVAATASQTSYMRNQTVAVNATVRAGGSPVSGATVTFTMTKANGSVVTSTATTGANGVASFSYVFNRKKDPAGTYQVRAQASSGGVSGSGVVSFAVK